MVYIFIKPSNDSFPYNNCSFTLYHQYDEHKSHKSQNHKEEKKSENTCESIQM